jgi:glycosyltransferase involved in cell wall biosynthesis
MEPVKSVHIIGSKAPAGAERFALRLMSAIRDRGEVVTAILRHGSTVVQHMDERIPVVETPMKTVWDPWSKFAIKRALRRLGPRIVQTYMGRATRLTRVPRSSGMVHIARLGGYYKLDGYRHAHAWIGNTKSLCDYMVQGGLPAEKVHHIYNFIDTPEPGSKPDTNALREIHGIPVEAWVIATAGRFIQVKGHAHLLKAFARMPGSVDGRPIWLAMVGDGPLWDDLHLQALQLGVAGRICWPGWQAQPELFYQLADVVAFPSLGRETLGNVILEAWAYRKPLVTTTFPGAVEITRHGEDALQVPYADHVALSDALVTLLSDELLRNELIMAGHKKVTTEFSREMITDRYLDLYNSLLKGV